MIGANILSVTAVGWTTLSTLIVSAVTIIGGILRVIQELRQNRDEIDAHLHHQDSSVQEIHVLVNGRLSEALHAAEVYAKQLIDAGVVPAVPVPPTILSESVEARVEPALTTTPASALLPPHQLLEPEPTSTPLAPLPPTALDGPGPATPTA